jgi:hypothetical protein
VSGDKSQDEQRYGPEEPDWIEPLSREPVRLRETTTDEELDREISERLGAILESRSLAANAAGWRDLALHLLIQKGAPLEFVTDLDLVQGGPDGSALDHFILRSTAKKLKELGQAKDNVEAAKLLAKAKGEKRAWGTINKLLSKPKISPHESRVSLWPRADRRIASEWRVLRILERVANRLEGITN